MLSVFSSAKRLCIRFQLLTARRRRIRWSARWNTRLSLLKDHAVVVNIARGAVVEQGTLAAELSSGRLRAVLDVFEEEPLPEDSILWNLPNVVLTPHNSFIGDGDANRLATVILQNLKQFPARGE